MSQEEKTERSLNWASVITAVIALVSGTLAAIFGQSHIHGNSDAVDVVITAFSILAGFLIAIITILGDPTTLLPGGHRVITKQRRMIRRQLMRKNGLFYVYLITLGLIFISKLLPVTSNVLLWVERAYLFLATVGFVLSFRLPAALKNVQERRIEIAIEERKKTADEGETCNAV